MPGVVGPRPIRGYAGRTTDRYASTLALLLPLVGRTPVTTDTSKPTDTADTADTASHADELGCYSVSPDTTTCPAAAEVGVADVIPETCGATVLSVDGAGTVETCAWIGGFAAGWCV